MFTEPLGPVNLFIPHNGIEFVECLERFGVQAINGGPVGILAVVVLAHKDLTRVPVVGHLMVIPLDVDRCLCQKGLHLLITMIVLPIGTEVIQCDRQKVLGRVVRPISAAEFLGNLFDGRDRCFQVGREEGQEEESRCSHTKKEFLSE